MRHFFAVSAAAVPLLGALAVALLNGCGAANGAAVSVNSLGLVNGDYSMHITRPQHINIGLPYDDTGSTTPNGAHVTWTIDGTAVTAMPQGSPLFQDTVPGAISKDRNGLILFQFADGVSFLFVKEGNSALRVGTNNKPPRITGLTFGRRYTAGATNANFVSGRSPPRENVANRDFTVTRKFFNATADEGTVHHFKTAAATDRCDWIGNDEGNPNSLFAIDGNGQNSSGDVIVFRFQSVLHTFVGQVNAGGGSVTRGTFMDDSGTLLGSWRATISGSGTGLGKISANN